MQAAGAFAEALVGLVEGAVSGEVADDIDFAGRVVDRAAELVVPGLPLAGGAFDELEIGAGVVGAADDLGQVGGGGALVGDSALLVDDNLVAALAQLKGGGQTEDTGADDADAHGQIETEKSLAL